MFTHRTLPLWVAIIVLASMYLMGQGWNAPPPSGPPAPVAKTGQTTSYATGDDGYLEMGVAWPDPRFTENGDGSVTDNLTGLTWTQNANCYGLYPWAHALAYCNALADGTCGLTDGSIAGDWRLANRFELESLLDMENWEPALPAGHPFTAVQSSWYWSSTTIPYYAWYVDFRLGDVSGLDKTDFCYAWCVRGGQ